MRYHFPLRLLALFFFLLPTVLLTAQSLTDFNQQRLGRTRRSMMVLGTWAAANIAVGVIGMSRTTGETKAFHQMNLGWGAVNLGLAASGWWTATHTDPAGFDLYQSTLEHHKLQKILLFNAGLDVGYVMAGLYMQERSKTTTKQPERLRGFGRSVVLQGAFLLVFDLGAWLYHHRLEHRMPPLFQQTTIGAIPGGVGAAVRIPI
jgi:hypothetical protein